VGRGGKTSIGGWGRKGSDGVRKARLSRRRAVSHGITPEGSGRNVKGDPRGDGITEKKTNKLAFRKASVGVTNFYRPPSEILRGALNNLRKTNLLIVPSPRRSVTQEKMLKKKKKRRGPA